MASHMGPLFGVHRTVGSPGRHASAEADFDPGDIRSIVAGCTASEATTIWHRGLFDHLVGAKQERLWDGEADRLRCLEVQDHLELGRKLHREIGRLCTAQNAIDIGGGTTKEVYLVDSVVEQTAVSRKGR